MNLIALEVQDHFDSTTAESTNGTSSPVERRLRSEPLAGVTQLEHIVLVRRNTHK